MRAPEFWATGGGAAPGLLAPLGFVWHTGGLIKRFFAARHRIPVPVICVGNLTAGGAGKTPLCLAIGSYLRDRGRDIHFLSRGYGGRKPGPVRVDLARHSAVEVGDEPLLLGRIAPVWVARNRAAGARAAVDEGADIIVMDDGFQNTALIKDLSILAVDGGYGFGNGRLIPAGPLREPVAGGLARAEAAVLIGDDRVGLGPALERRLPVLRARLKPDQDACTLGGQTVLAFAGIARPAKFYETLREIGCRIVARWDFPDHHRYTPEEVMEICETAHAHAALPVTTAKDAVRLPSEARSMVRVVGVTLAWQAPDDLDSLLQPILG